MNKVLDYIEEGDEIISEDTLLEMEGVMPVAQTESSTFPASAYDKSKSFEQNLSDLFFSYRKSKLKLIPKIVHEFKGREQEAFDYLHYKYAVWPKSLLNKTALPAYSESKKVVTSIKYEPKEKVQIQKKPKTGLSILWIIVGVFGVLVLAGLLWYFLASSKPENVTPQTSVTKASMGIIEASQEKLKTALSKEDSIRIIEQALDEGMTNSDTLK